MNGITCNDVDGVEQQVIAGILTTTWHLSVVSTRHPGKHDEVRIDEAGIVEAAEIGHVPANESSRE